jgi:hypothetical protein
VCCVPAFAHLAFLLPSISGGGVTKKKAQPQQPEGFASFFFLGLFKRLKTTTIWQ